MSKITIPDEVVERLQEYAKDDHERLCQGREYSCTCGYDDKRDTLLQEAADCIIAFCAETDRWRSMYREVYAVWDGRRAEVGMLRDEIERLRSALQEISSTERDSCSEWFQDIARAALAQEARDAEG